MIKRTIWQFDLPITDEMSAAEYSTMVSVLRRLTVDSGFGLIGSIDEDGDNFVVRIEEVDAA